MQPGEPVDSVYRFGDFHLRPQAGELRRGGQAVPLQRQPLRVLVLLIERAGKVVPRREIFTAVWGEAVHVDFDRGLNYCIRQIRRALADDADYPLYVETVPRYGYRFIAKVTALPEHDRAEPSPGGAVSPRPSIIRPLRRRLLVGAAAALLLVMTPVVAWWTDRMTSDAPAVPPGAFADYLHGRHLMEQGSPADLHDAIEALERAVALAPGFARGHLALAGAYARLQDDPAAAVAGARRELRRAIELDDTLAEAHMKLAGIRIYNDWDFAGAEDSLRRAVELDPDSAAIRHLRASYFSMVGRHDEAIAEVERAMALDPVSTVIKSDAAWFYYQARRYDEAIALGRATLELDRENQGALWSLVQSYRQRGEIDAALSAARHLTGVLDPAATLPADLDRFWRWYLDFNERTGARQGSSPSISGLIHLALGERDTALDLFEQAAERRLGCVLSLASDPQLDPLRDEPRFSELLRRIGLSG